MAKDENDRQVDENEMEKRLIASSQKVKQEDIDKIIDKTNEIFQRLGGDSFKKLVENEEYDFSRYNFFLVNSLLHRNKNSEAKKAISESKKKKIIQICL